MARNSGTGVPDPVYDLTSVLYHALQGADEELAAFFREAGEQNERRAQRALQLLARHARQ